jgi:hypothetical protein
VVRKPVEIVKVHWITIFLEWHDRTRIWRIGQIWADFKRSFRRLE